MPELLSVALVCASTLLAKDCSRDTALDVMVAPARTPMECLMHGQTAAAATGLTAGESRYLKVTCERRHAGQQLRQADAPRLLGAQVLHVVDTDADDDDVSARELRLGARGLGEVGDVAGVGARAGEHVPADGPFEPIRHAAREAPRDRVAMVFDAGTVGHAVAEHDEMRLVTVPLGVVLADRARDALAPGRTG